ncbi:xylulokinase [Falsochrobactrum shanghaiense]|uniref:Xylulose kinase n=1 Tax=Falsochrobactrum shanghaiense TaxID=2201899 RepID=A0A316JQM9_9HYPH|nr:xylulokinase [Falsochrobactrum shanghaiense]PWL17540.1 xylulokinase [Falsochrobactrum shanghaiense]
MYLGLDLGTSGVKALLIDDAQKPIGSGHGALDVSRPQQGWSEQDPAQWVKACETAIDELRSSFPKEFAAIVGIGLSGQMHGATLLDTNDEVLRPCILWNDTRSYQEAAELDADPAFRAISGNIVFPGFTAPKLVWVARNEPDIFARISKVLLPKDYLRLWLSGEYVSDMSDSAGTSWLDTGARRWSPELLAKTGLAESHMPSLAEGCDVTGRLRAELASRWGLANRPVIAGGAGDNAASACGMGTVRPGHAFISLGTSGVLFAATASYQPKPESAVHTFCHALPDTWHQMGVILSAASAFEWYSGIVGSTPRELDRALGEHLKAPGSLTFLPYLSGERTPYNDAKIRGAFTGLEHEMDRNAMTQAVLEGVAFAIRDNLAALQSAGAEISALTAVGGGSRSSYWLKAIATALDLPILLPAESELGAAFGAARLGLIAATGADPLAICSAPSTARAIEPEQALLASYDEAYRRYHALYPALQGLA